MRVKARVQRVEVRSEKEAGLYVVTDGGSGAAWFSVPANDVMKWLPGTQVTVSLERA